MLTNSIVYFERSEHELSQLHGFDCGDTHRSNNTLGSTSNSDSRRCSHNECEIVSESFGSCCIVNSSCGSPSGLVTISGSCSHNPRERHVHVKKEKEAKISKRNKQGPLHAAASHVPVHAAASHVPVCASLTCDVPSFCSADGESVLRPPACPMQRRNLKATTLIDHEQTSAWVKVNHGQYEKRSNVAHNVRRGSACSVDAVEDLSEHSEEEQQSQNTVGGGRGKYSNVASDVPLCVEKGTLCSLDIAEAPVKDEPPAEERFIAITWNATGLPQDADWPQIKEAVRGIAWDLLVIQEGISGSEKEIVKQVSCGHKICWGRAAKKTDRCLGFVLHSKWSSHFGGFTSRGRAAAIDVNIGADKLSFLTCHIPHSGHSESDVDQAYADLTHLLQQKRNKGRLCCIGGDFNGQLGPGNDEQDNTPIVGKHALGKRNGHGDRIVEIAILGDFCIANTMYPSCTKRCDLWTHERPCGEKVQIDYWLVPQTFVRRMKCCKVVP